MEQSQLESASTARYARRRDAIVAAATVIMNEQGIKGMTLPDVAEAVGLNATSVAYYFKRKEDLAAACFENGIARFEGFVAQAATRTDPVDRLARLLDVYLEEHAAIRAGEAQPLAVISDIRALGPEHYRRIADLYVTMFRNMRELLRTPDKRWLNKPARTARTQILLEQLLWSAYWLPRYDVDDFPRVRDRMLDILVNGIAAPGETWAPSPPKIEPETANSKDMSTDAFLRAATRLINQRGYRGASVKDISAALNVTKGSFYHHNETKDDVVVACFHKTAEVMRRCQRRVRELEGNQWLKLSSVAAALVEYQLSDDGPLLRTSALKAVPQAIQRDMVVLLDRVADHFGAMLADGIADGSIRPIDQLITSQMLMAMINAASEVNGWVAEVERAELAAFYAKPLLMGMFRE